MEFISAAYNLLRNTLEARFATKNSHACLRNWRKTSPTNLTPFVLIWKIMFSFIFFSFVREIFRPRSSFILTDKRQRVFYFCFIFVLTLFLFRTHHFFCFRLFYIELSFEDSSSFTQFRGEIIPLPTLFITSDIACRIIGITKPRNAKEILVKGFLYCELPFSLWNRICFFPNASSLSIHSIF